jgi:hypothetical protein
MGHEQPGTTYKYDSKLAHNDIRDVIIRKKIIPRKYYFPGYV